MIEVPWTLMFTGASGEVAGPFTTEPLTMLNLLPWHGQLMVPPDTVVTRHPRWVQTAVNASIVPARGWVITIFLSARILPPPTGMSEVLARTSPGLPFPFAFSPPVAAGEFWAGGAPASPPWLALWVAHPASAATHVAPAPASTARRLDVEASGPVMTCLLSSPRRFLPRVDLAVDAEGREEPVGRAEPDRDQDEEHHGARHRKHPAWHSALGQDQHLDRERAEERAAQYRVDQDPGAVGLEAEPVEAVDRDRHGQQERDPARPPVRPADTRRRRNARDLAVHDQGRDHLDDREDGGAGGQPRFRVARAGEPGEADRDAGRVVQPPVDAEGERDQPADQAGHDQLGDAQGRVLRCGRYVRLCGHIGLPVVSKLAGFRIRCR